ncbi:unnamed protein product [Brachionus calyciflorus]|uniref:Diacylglycerol kinase n=1 Tax=Brachionus calyciflorus TaxID=104777 RepID=A0A813REP8_9BILA|nr:unnamed protein product [Brachionus calyciflorus]
MGVGMDDWIQALTNTSRKEPYSRKVLNGNHSWYVCSHARPTFCNVCGEALTGVTSHGLSCEICKFKAHKRCAAKATKSCKWTTLASIDSKELIENEDRNLLMPHQWLEGNLPVNAKCSYCDKACGSVLHMQDFRCLWCKSYVHAHCKNLLTKICDLGSCRVSILPPTHINYTTSDGYIQASKAINCSPLVVFVNSKSGDNQGIKFLRRFKQLLNPFQVFDLINGGPILGLRLFQSFDCFRVLVCGGDGSVGWVLKEIDNLDLHKQCQIGVLPLGTGNDLARVLGWGGALDDDNQLPKLLETFERSTTKMLDRWSIMTYCLEDDSKEPQIPNNKNENIPLENKQENLKILETEILYNINNLVLNDSIQAVIESTHNLNDKISKLKYNFENRVFFSDKIKLNFKFESIYNLIREQLNLMDKKLIEFYNLLKSELKGSLVDKEDVNIISSSTDTTSGGESEWDENESNLQNKLKLLQILFKTESIQFSSRNNSLYRKYTRSQVSSRFKNRRKIIIKLSNFKKLLKQIIQLIDLLILFDSLKSQNESLNNLNEKISDLLLKNIPHSLTTTSINSNLTINKNLGFHHYDSSCPLASEEQSCMSSPNAGKLSPSNSDLLLIRPNVLDFNSQRVSIKILCPSNEPSIKSFRDNERLIDSPPEIRIDDDDNSIDYYSNNNNLLKNSYFNSKSVPGLNFLNVNDDLNERKNLSQPFLFPGSTSNLNSLNTSSYLSSASSNDISTNYLSSNSLRPSPSGYSSSGSYLTKTPIASPRISKKYFRAGNKNYLQLPGVMSALSMNSLRSRSRSKSTDKSSSPTSPSSPKFTFKRSNDCSLGFIEQALLFNANTLCAPIAPPVINEPFLELYSEKTVMNNYFGIGIDAKLCLEFHITREEHPEKCKSRIRNHMLYSLLGSKELVQRTYRNLEQKVRLECDGVKIPLKNVQGIVVLNIPSYTGGVNFWGPNSKDENVFTTPSFDDKILEVVSISGAIQMALSRVVSLKSNRIAQCRSVKIQIVGNEGVPVQVDGEAWVQQPGYIQIIHKNRAQMLTRNKIFEHTLKTWSEKQKNDPQMSKDELIALQRILDDASSLIKRIKTASLRNVLIEQDLNGYAIQAASNLSSICFNGKLDEKSSRQQLTDFLNSIRTLMVESNIFIGEKALKNGIESDCIEKIQLGLNDLKIDMKRLNECHGIYQFPIDNNESESKRTSRFNLVQRYKKSKLKQKDDRELLKTLHSIPVEEWGPEEVGLWLESLNLCEYKDAFMRHDIRGTEIRNLDRRDLRELGIVKVGHIKRILNAAKDIPKRIATEKKSV